MFAQQTDGLFPAANKGSLWESSQGEWKLAFGSNLRDKTQTGALLRSAPAERSRGRCFGSGVFSPNSRAGVNKPSFLMHLGGSSPRNFQCVQAGSWDSQLSDSTSRCFSSQQSFFTSSSQHLDGCLTLYQNIFQQWSRLKWAEVREGRDRLPLSEKDWCKMWGMCTASCLSPADPVRPLHLGAWNLNYCGHDELKDPVHPGVLHFLCAGGIIKGVWSKPWSKYTFAGIFFLLFWSYERSLIAILPFMLLFSSWTSITDIWSSISDHI